MDILEFFAGSEWPVVVGGTLWFARSQLKAMVDRINPTKIEGWGFKAEFDRVLDKVEVLVPPEKPSLPEKATPQIAMDGKLPERVTASSIPSTTQVGTASTVMLERLSPEARILASWEDFLQEVAKARERAGIIQRKFPLSGIKELGFDADELAAFEELRGLRNQVAHAQVRTLSADDAKRFEDIVSRLRMKMQFG